MKQILTLVAALFLVVGFQQKAEAKRVCIKFKKICIRYAAPVVKKNCVSWKNQTRCAKYGPKKRCVKLVSAGRVCIKYVFVKSKRACVGGWKRKCIKW
ncbi:hypothetical protein L6R29_13335 [Myxococcota bacterium]|nr:hypothetical protein [Myxococcota bacterium]